MSKRKRIKEKKTKALSPEQLATPDQTSIGRRFVMVWDAPGEQRPAKPGTLK